MADQSPAKTVVARASTMSIRTPPGRVLTQSVTPKKRPRPYWLGGMSDMALYGIDLTGTISGTVSMPSGASPVLARVTLYSKSVQMPVATVHPDAAGAFTFTGVDRTSQNEYFAICEVPGSFNAVVYDKLVIA